MGKNYFSQLSNLFLHTGNFFNKVEKEKGYKKILFFYIIIASIVIAVNFIFSVIIALANSNSHLIIDSFISAVFGVGAAFAFPFIGSAIVHVGVLVFGGKKGYFNTFKPITYASALGQIYNLIVIFISFLFFVSGFNFTNPALTSSSKLIFFALLILIIYLAWLVHVIYAQIIGIAKFQKITKLRAFLSIIFIPLIIIIITTLIFFIIFQI